LPLPVPADLAINEEPRGSCPWVFCFGLSQQGVEAFFETMPASSARSVPVAATVFFLAQFAEGWGLSIVYRMFDGLLVAKVREDVL
jgi:hypothetical protein